MTRLLTNYCFWIITLAVGWILTLTLIVATQ